MSIPAINIKCEDDGGIDNITLQNFPCVPHESDYIWINGCKYIVVMREFITNSGLIDGSVDGVIVHLKKA